jgi:hypothetical protein
MILGDTFMEIDRGKRLRRCTGLLEKGRLCPRGSDKDSKEATETLNLLIVAALTADLTSDKKNAIPFRSGMRLNARPS